MKNNLKMEDKKIMQSMLDAINKAKKIIKDTKAESINNISLPIDFVEQLLNMVVQHMENEENKTALLQLYRRLVNQNLQVNLHILEKIKELEND